MGGTWHVPAVPMPPGSPLQAMQLPAPLLLLLPALLSPAGTSHPGHPCSVEMNKVKDLLEVNCTGQALSAVPPDLPADTGILLLSANRLVSVSITSFLPLPQLQDLDLSDTGLVALHLGPPLPALRELLLSRNALEALPALQGLPALTRLALAHNRVAALASEAFRAVPHLQDLDLRGNLLRTLPAGAFAGLRALKDLDISDNALEELPKELLRDLQGLETLWLSGNRLRSLPSGFFPEGQIFMYVFLTENPWHCDCGLHYLRGWIRRNEGSVYQPERGLEKTKVEVAPERVLCHSPPEHQGKPIIHFKPNCGNVGDGEEEEEDDYGDGDAAVEEAAKAAMPPPQPPTPKGLSPMPRAGTSPPLSTLSASPTNPRAPSTTSPAPASPTLTPTPAPSTATAVTAAPARTPHRAPTSPPAPTVSTGTFPTTSMALPSTAAPEASSIATSSPPPLTATTPRVSTTHALDATGFTQPAPSPPPAPLPLCPCSTPGPDVPVLRSWAAGDAPQGGHWVLDHCCLLQWGLYLACLALLVLTVLALAGWLAWMCLVGWPSWHKSLRTQDVPYLLLRWRESAGSPVMHLSSSQSPLQHTRFCTIKEVELYPQVTYCTIKDLGIQCSPPAGSFCTTKELWIHQSPLNASLKSFSGKLMVTNLGSLRTPSAYSLDRGVKAIGDVRVPYAGNTL
ncbi:platelet glycoprotein Ib alpha chain [Ara ararauna]